MESATQNFHSLEDEQSESLLVGCLSWLMRHSRVQPKVWETYRKEEIRLHIEDQRATIVGRVLSDRMLYLKFKHRKRKYIGERDRTGRFEGRGVCDWPDPPRGGGGVLTHFLSPFCQSSISDLRYDG